MKSLPYFCRGEVIRGFGRGSKELGIPTGESVIVCPLIWTSDWVTLADPLHDVSMRGSRRVASQSQSNITGERTNEKRYIITIGRLRLLPKCPKVYLSGGSELVTKSHWTVLTTTPVYVTSAHLFSFGPRYVRAEPGDQM